MTEAHDSWVRSVLGIDVAARHLLEGEVRDVVELVDHSSDVDTAPLTTFAPQPLKPCMPQDIPPHERAKLPTPDNAGSQDIAERLAKVRDLEPSDPLRVALVEDYARASTHMQPPPDRVVLGSWTDPGGGGYIDKAKEAGGVWYETPRDTFAKVGPEVAWESNASFLRQQMASAIKKIEFEDVKIDDILREGAVIAQDIADGVKGVKQRARFKEVQLLLVEGPLYGYKRVGDAFVKES